MITEELHGKIAAVFPGQGAQKTGMFHELYEESAIVRETFKEASELLHYDLFQTAQDKEKNINYLSLSTPLIFTSSVAAFRDMEKRYDVKPSMLAGHSLGEFSALTCTGAFTFEQGLNLVMYRAGIAQRIKEESETVMLIIARIDQRQVEEMCRHLRAKGKQVWVSCYNDTKQVCVCGKRDDLEAFTGFVAQNNGYHSYLEYNAPFHTPFMNSGKEELFHCIENIPLGDLKYPVLSSTNGRAFHKDNIARMLANQLVEPVQWKNTMNQLERIGYDCYVECGCGSILQKLLKRNMAKRMITGYEKIQ